MKPSRRLSAKALATLSLGAVCMLMALGPAPAAAQTVVVAAGDIACDPEAAGFNGGLGTFGADPRCHQKYTSDLFAALGPAVVLALGDLQYGSGDYEDFLASYDRRDASGTAISWGRARAITRPVPGNHEYAERDAATGALTGARGYYDYFNGAGVHAGLAGERDKGYYSFDLTAGARADGSPVRWHLVAVNSMCAAGPAIARDTGWLGACAPGSAQERWLRDDLAAAAAAGAECTLAYWHHPRFSAVAGDDDAALAPMWQALFDHGADLVLSGHHHLYERFAPLDPAGAPAPGRGIRSFVVGTGGRDLGAPPGPLSRVAEAIDVSTFGVLKLVLHDGWYEWEFVPDGRSGAFRDAGRASCVKPPTAVVAGPAGLAAGPAARFEFSGSPSTAAFECRLDEGAWQRCASPVTFAGVADGPHAFSVRAIDFAGAAEPTPPVRTFTLDSTPPAVSLTGPRRGAFLAGRATLTAEPADANGIARVDWLVDGAPVASDVAAPWTGSWRTRTVADGRRRLRARATDLAGNTATTRPVLVTVGNRPLRARAGIAGGRSLRSLARAGLAVRVRCSRPCRADARVTLPRATARRLSLPRRLARHVDRRLRPRRAALRLRPRPAVRRTLRRVRRARVVLQIRVADAGRNRRTVRRTVVLR